MKETQVERLTRFYLLEKDFSPCLHCSNVVTDICLNKCTEEMKYEEFKLRPGTGIKDLPEYPIKDVLKFPDPYFRMVVVSIYLAAITDYLQHEDEYKAREQAPHKEKSIIPEGFMFKRLVPNGNDTDNSRSR